MKLILLHISLFIAALKTETNCRYLLVNTSRLLESYLSEALLSISPYKLSLIQT